MARPNRNDVDYFPHYISGGKKMNFIENKYGNDGYATWFKILESMAATEYHYLNLNDEVEAMFLASKCKITETVLLAIIDDLVKLNMFSKVAWNNKIIWCEKFIDSIQTVYEKRTNNTLSLLELSELLLSLGILKLGFTELKGGNKPQSKVKYTKVENIYKSFGKLSITLEEVEKLKTEGFTAFQIDEILTQIENYKGNSKYNSLIATARIWMKKNNPKKEPSKSDNLPEVDADAFFRRGGKNEK